MRTKKTKVNNTHIKVYRCSDGISYKGIRYKGGVPCPKCGKEIRTVSRFGRRVQIEVGDGFLLADGGVNMLIDKDGVRHFGHIVEVPDRGGSYVFGHKVHECCCAGKLENGQ